MADEEVVVASTAIPVPSDHKRKLHDVETEPESDPTQDLALDTSNAIDSGSYDKADVAADADSPDAKRARLDDEKPDDELASENGHQAEEIEESTKESDEQATIDDNPSKEVEPQLKEEQKTVNNEHSLPDNLESGGSEQPPIENAETEVSEEPSKVGAEQPSGETPQQVGGQDEQTDTQKESTSRKMVVPNNKVGVLIGKAGETIRLLQYNSGAKIQITRDVEADPHSATRSVELIGTPDNINKAEKLIKDVIAEADAGGSPSLVARGIASAQAARVAEQFLMHVPNEKVGLIIGRAGETIKGLQTRSGARIQLIPQHLPEGEERTVRVTGDKKQIEIARELIKEVMNQTVRASPLSSNNNQQGYRPSGPGAPPQWGQRGVQPSAYDYHQRGIGSYPCSNPPSTYGGQQMGGPRSGFGSGWEQRPPSSMQLQGGGGGGYDYYGGHSAHGPGAPPPSYNYGHPSPYSQAVPQQTYGHGYGGEPKFENQAPAAQHYGGHVSKPGFGLQQQHQYGKPPSYSSFGPRASQPQPGEMPYQGGPTAVQQPYVAPQQYQQTYPPPPYGSTATDGYNNQQQQPPASYPHPSGQQAAGYGQVAGYGQYPATQGGYTEQSASNNVGYGYQDPALTGTGYGGYAQPQPGYEQQQSGVAYGGNAPATGYGI